MPERPKNTAVSLFSIPMLDEQCIGRTPSTVGNKKLSTEKIPFFISPEYSVPPIRIILLVKFTMAKFSCLVPSVVGSALNSGQQMIVKFGSKSGSLYASGLMNML